MARRASITADHFDGRMPAPGRLYKIDQRGSLALDILGEPDVDTSKMCASAIICTSAVDREDEVILPSGVDTSDYEANPVVLWAHGLEPLVPTAIAKCEHPDGQLALEFGEEQIYGTSYFTNRNQISEQMFGLIDAGIVRATSIHVMPDYSLAKVQMVGGRRVSVFPESSMIEWSWGNIGVNPEAVAKMLHTNRVAGRQLCEPLVKMLSPYAAPLKSLGKGWTPENAMAKSKTKEMTAEEEKPEEQQPDGGAAKAPEEPPVEPAKPEEPSPEEVETDPVEMPLGAQVLSAVHASLSDLVANIEGAVGPLENVEVKTAMEAMRDGVMAMLTEAEGVYAGQYKDYPALKMSDEENVQEAELVKSWLAESSRYRYQLDGLGVHLKALLGASNLTKGQRKSVQRVLQQFGQMSEQARRKSLAPKQAESEIPAEVLEGFNSVAESFKAIHQQISSIVPHRRAV